jgi:hypothetical protein
MMMVIVVLYRRVSTEWFLRASLLWVTVYFGVVVLFFIGNAAHLSKRGQCDTADVALSVICGFDVML